MPPNVDVERKTGSPWVSPEKPEYLPMETTTAVVAVGFSYTIPIAYFLFTSLAIAWSTVSKPDE